MTFPTTNQWVFSATVDRVIDGDTFDAIVDLGFKLYAKVRFRLKDVDTPERGHADWKLAKDMLAELLDKAKYRDEIIVTSIKTGKYGRWLAEIEGVNDTLAKRWPYPKVDA